MSVRRTGGAGPLDGPHAGAAAASLRDPSGREPAPAAAVAWLPGTAAPGSAAGPNIFTAIAYETGAAAGQLSRRFAFVGSAAGVVFQVDYPRCVTFRWPGRLVACWCRVD
jgi:hypothetical protein